MFTNITNNMDGENSEYQSRPGMIRPPVRDGRLSATCWAAFNSHTVGEQLRQKYFSYLMQCLSAEKNDSEC